MRLTIRALTLLTTLPFVVVAPAATRAAAPPPYSLPWNLRPVGPVRVLRLDTVVAGYEDAQDHSGSTLTSLLLASTKLGPRVSLLGRIGSVRNDPPVGKSATVPTNLVVGGAYALKPAGSPRVGLYLLAALPTGGGGGNTPDAAEGAAIRSGVASRSAMDNAMFAVNDFVLFPGLDVAWVSGGWTAQAEATLLQLWRVRGEEKQVDVRRTNFTTGFHLGYFVLPRISLGGEFRYQRWLSTPAAVKTAPKGRDTATAALGARLHFKLGPTAWFRPGVSLALPLDDPLGDADYQIVQVDLPFNF